MLLHASSVHEAFARLLCPSIMHLGAGPYVRALPLVPNAGDRLLPERLVRASGHIVALGRAWARVYQLHACPAGEGVGFSPGPFAPNTAFMRLLHCGRPIRGNLP
jgi:hypothetical protein